MTTTILQKCRSEEDTKIEASFYLPDLDAAGIRIKTAFGYKNPTACVAGESFVLHRGNEQIVVEVNSTFQWGKTYRRFQGTKRPHTMAKGGPTSVSGISTLAHEVVQ